MKKLESGDILKPSYIGIIFPAGIFSMAGLGMWIFVLMVPLIGLINKPDIVIRDLKNTSAELYILIGEAIFLIILVQILFRLIVKRKRIIIDDNYVYIKNIIFSKEIEIINVKAIKKISDRALLSTNISLLYENGSRSMVNGWLMKWSEMDRLTDYIDMKNTGRKENSIVREILF